MDMVIDVHNEMNEYKLLKNNCTHVAKTAWNRAIYGYFIGEDSFPAGHSTQDTPLGLYIRISDWEGSYEIDLRKLLGI